MFAVLASKESTFGACSCMAFSRVGSVGGEATTSIADGAIVGLTNWKTRVGSKIVKRDSEFDDLDL